MESQIGVLIVCCNRLLRESIARIATKKGGFQVIGAQPIGSTSAQEIAESGPDVVVLDSLQFVLEEEICFSETLSHKRAVKCVLVAMDDDQRNFLRAVRRGVLGYVLQEASAADVVAAIRAVAAGEAVCPPRFARVLFDYIASQPAEFRASRTREQLGLTRREQELIPLIGRGLTNKEIANQLNVSEQTVKSHIHRILRKVGVEDRSGVSRAWHMHTASI